jgi:hypothetical protein
MTKNKPISEGEESETKVKWEVKFLSMFCYRLESGKYNITRSDPWLVMHLISFIQKALEEARKEERNKMIIKLQEFFVSGKTGQYPPYGLPPSKETLAYSQGVDDMIVILKNISKE